MTTATETPGLAMVWPSGSALYAEPTGYAIHLDGETLAVIGQEVTLYGGEYSAVAAAEFVDGDLPDGCGNGTYLLVFGSSLTAE